MNGAAPSTEARPLRIVELYSPLTVAGGAERQFLEEVRGLAAHGHEVSPVTFALADEALLVPSVPRERIRVLPGRSVLGRVRALRGYLRAARPDLLVAHTSAELAWAATRGSGISLVAYHNSPISIFLPDTNPYLGLWRQHPAFRSGRVALAREADFPHLPRRSLTARVTREARALSRHVALRGAADVIVVSQRAAQELALVHGVHASVIRGCLPAAATPRVAVGDLRAELGIGAAPVILSVCRLSPERRLDLLLRSFAALRARGRDACLVIAGRGDEEPYLRRLASLLGVTDRVRFAGFVPETELIRYHSLAHVFAAPARADYNIAPYEALAAGCNVVITTEMELDEVVQASARVVVCQPTEEDLARALGAALDRPLGPPPPLAHLTWEARTLAVASLYRDIVARGAAMIAATGERSGATRW